MKKLLAGMFGSAFLLASCSSPVTNEGYDPTEEVALDGKELMEKNCHVCHAPPGSENRSAPPIHKVKNHYLDDETTKDDFVDAVVEWVKEPSEDKSLMPGARRNWGMMPKQDFDEKEVKAIAQYMFDNEL